MRIPVWQALLVMGLLLAQSGCGFHLRGAANIPAWLKPVHLSGDASISDELLDDLRRSLVASGVPVARSADGAAIMKLNTERFHRQLMAVSGAGRIKEYAISYDVLVSVSDANGRVRLARAPVTVFRELVYDEQHVHASSAEEGMIRQEMRRAMVIQILRVLQSDILRKE